MGYSTVSSVIDVIRGHVDHSSKSDTAVLDLINNGMRQLQRENFFVFEQAKATGTIATVGSTLQTWTFPSDMKAPIRFYQVISGEHWTVYNENFFVAVDEFAGATDAQQVQRFSFWTTSGYLFPRLSTAIQYEFYYSKFLADFTSVTAANTILEDIPEALEYAGTAEYYDFLGESKRAEIWRQKAALAVRNLMKQNRWRDESAQTAVPTTYGTIGRQR